MSVSRRMVRYFFDTYNSTYGGMLGADGVFNHACPGHSEAIENYYDGRLRTGSRETGWLLNEESRTDGWNSKYDLAYLDGFAHIEFGGNYADEDDDDEYADEEGYGNIRIEYPGAEPTAEQKVWVAQLMRNAKEYGVDVYEYFHKRPYSEIYRSQSFNYIFDAGGETVRKQVRESVASKIMRPENIVSRILNSVF